MKYTHGTAGADVLEGTSGSDIMFGNDGDDQIYSSLDGNTPYAIDRLYGGKGDDILGFDLNDGVVRALKAGALVKPFADGGAGNDTAIIYYDGPAGFGISELTPLIHTKSIEQWSFYFGNTKGVIEGTSGSDRLGASTDGTVKLAGGAGNDRLEGEVSNGRLTMDGGAGADVLSAYYLVGQTRATAIGGIGKDQFVFNDFGISTGSRGGIAYGMNVSDFHRGEDKIVIDLSDGNYGLHYYAAFHTDAFHPKSDKNAYDDHVDYDDKTGMLKVDGHIKGIIEGSPHLTASDFLFF
jgi:Ca2+-binding RTX toxin-like protein